MKGAELTLAETFFSEPPAHGCSAVQVVFVILLMRRETNPVKVHSKVGEGEGKRMTSQ